MNNFELGYKQDNKDYHVTGLETWSQDKACTGNQETVGEHASQA